MEDITTIETKELLSDINALQNLMRERVSMHMVNSSQPIQDYYMHSSDGSLADLICQSKSAAKELWALGELSPPVPGEGASNIGHEMNTLYEEFHMRVADHLSRMSMQMRDSLTKQARMQDVLGRWKETVISNNLRGCGL
jgi:hypothetical protein